MLRADPVNRPHPTKRLDAPWHSSPWNVFWVIVGAILTASIIQWIVVATVTATMARTAADELQRDIERTLGTVQAPSAAPEAGQRYETITVPPQDRDTCLAASGGVADEEFARCRRGYSYQRAVTD